MSPQDYIKWNLKSINQHRITQMAMGIYDEVHGIHLEQDAEESHRYGNTLRETVWTQTGH